VNIPRKRPSFPATLNPASVQAVAGKVLAQPKAAGVDQAPSSRISPQAINFNTSMGTGLDSAAVRTAMVRKLQEQGLSDPQVLKAFGRIERHGFVDSALVAQAYEDTSLPIGLGQTISKPSVVGRMMELLLQGQSGKLGRVLEIGTGCGYQAALLSCVCSEIYSIERLRGLYDKARENLRPMRLPNVHTLLGDGMLGYPKGAPYAGIIAAAGGHAIPQPWLDQLAVGGRIVAPAELVPGKQSLVVIERTATGFERQELEAVWFVPLKSGIH
jgi:protein-L-isoaspartate(D-aspartate) O-methyltransferase